MPTKIEIYEAAIAEYKSVAGRVVLLSCVETYVDSDSKTIFFQNPIPAIIKCYRTDEEIRDNVLHNYDDRTVDPYYNVEIVEAATKDNPEVTPELLACPSNWVFGTCRGTDGGLEPADFELASPELQIAFGRRILARVAGADNDDAIDVTNDVLDFSLEEIRALKDGDAAATMLRCAAPLRVVDRIAAYFQVASLDDVTEEMRSEARSERGMPDLVMSVSP